MTGFKYQLSTEETDAIAGNYAFGEDPSSSAADSNELSLSAMQQQFGMMRTQIAMMSLTIADMQLHIRQIEASTGVGATVGNDIGIDDDSSEDGYATNGSVFKAPRTLGRKNLTKVIKYESDDGYDTDEVLSKAPLASTVPAPFKPAKYDIDEGYDTDEALSRTPSKSTRQSAPSKPIAQTVAYDTDGYDTDESPPKGPVPQAFVYDSDDGYDTDEAFSRALCDASEEAREALEAPADAIYESDDGYDTDEIPPKEGAFVMVPPLAKIYGKGSDLSEDVKMTHF